MKKRTFSLLSVFILLTAVLLAAALFGCAGDGKVELSEDMITCEALDNTYVYTGQPVTFRDTDFFVRLDGRDVSIDLFDIEYKDNVAAGQASVTITAKPENDVVKGSVTLYFTISEATGVSCEAEDDLAALLSNPSVSGVMMWSNYTIPEGSTLTIPEGKTLNLIYGYTFRNEGTVINHGTIVMKGGQLSTGGRQESVFINLGTLTNHGDIECKDYAVFDDRGSFTSDKEISNLGVIYLLDEDKTFIVEGAGGVRYVRHPITAEDISVAECEFTQGADECTPAVTAAIRGAQFNVAYEDNIHAGEGRAIVTMQERDRYYYGSASIPFTIRKGQGTAATYEELSALVRSHDYNRYTITSLTIPAEASLNIEEGEVLTCNALTIRGKMSFAGDVTCSRFTVERGAEVYSEGMLRVTGTTFSISGTYTNGVHGDWTYGGSLTDMSISGTFINKGNVTGKSFGVISGTLKNEGSLDAEILPILHGTFVNSGVARFEGVAIYMYYASSAPASFINESGGVVTVTEGAILDGLFRNDGTFVNKGEISFEDGMTYSCDGTFDNVEGEVYAFTPLAGISDRFCLRKYLTDDEIIFEAEYLETPYNQHDQKPTFMVNGEPLDPENYTVKYRYAGASKDATECVNVGEITVTVTMMGTFTLYAGKREFTYRITPVAAHATASTLSSVVGDHNYDRIILDEDVTLTGGSIREELTLDLNGHKLTIAGQSGYYTDFKLYGTLTGGAAVDPDDFTPSEDVACLIIEDEATFNNYGRVVNAGFIYSKGRGGFRGNAVSYDGTYHGSVLNSGVIYTSADLVTEDASTGVVFRRQDLGDALSSFWFTTPEVYYDGTAKTPEPILEFGGKVVDLSRFTYTYSSNVDVGTGRLTLAVKDEFDPEYCGTVYQNFQIRAGVARVASEAAFIAAAANRNYERICLTGNVTLNSVVMTAQDVDLDLYELYFGENGGLTFTSGRVGLSVKADTEARLKKYFYAAKYVTLTADIGTPGVKTVLDFSDYRLSGVTGAYYTYTSVDMNGHSFLGGLKLENDTLENVYWYFVNSAEAESRIGSALGEVAFEYATCSEETFVTLDGLTVYGAYMGGGFDTAQHVSLTARKCSFLTATDVHKACAFEVHSTMTAEGEFSECLFSGANAFRADQGDYSFSDCTFCSYDSYSDSYLNHYGDAVLLDYYGRHGMNVEIWNCTLISENGNGVHLLNRNNAVSLRVYGEDMTYTGPLSMVVG